MPALAERHTVIAPDLMGHGASAKPMGDYSLGAFASSVRDLLLALGHERATVVGHSLGGGVAMQFSYQFPERVERLVLVSSGGLGREVHFMLRAATLPGADFVMPALAKTGALGAGAAVGRFLERIGLHPSPDFQGVADGWATLGDEEACRAFLHTARSIMDLGGQRVNASDKLYLAADMPVLIIWGERDPMIPVAHAPLRARADAAQPARGLRARRALPVQRRAAALRRPDQRLHGDDRARADGRGAAC